MTVQILTDSNLTDEQEELLTGLWSDSTGLWGHGWHPSGSFRFPETVQALEDICDNDAQVTQLHLATFISDVRHCYRCRVCGTGRDVPETGLCSDCTLDADED